MRKRKFNHWVTTPYRPDQNVPDEVLLLEKSIQRMEGKLAYERDRKAREIAANAVKHLGIDDDKPL